LAELLPPFVGFDDLFEFGKATANFAGHGLISVNCRVAHFLGQFGMFF
jgi:hypothetical protein